MQTTTTQDIATVNYAGGQAYKQSPEMELLNILLTSFVEDQFYRTADGTINQMKCVLAVSNKMFAAKAAIFARNEFGMRSITHIMAAELAKYIGGEQFSKSFFEKIVRRPDDMLEIMIYYKDHGGNKLSNAMKKGFSEAFNKFDEYQLAKYRGENSKIKLVDIVNMVHPAGCETNKIALAKLINGELINTETWESKLSEAGKQSTSVAEKINERHNAWLGMLKSKRLGYFALLKNLRNILLNQFTVETGDAVEIQAQIGSFRENRLRAEKHLRSQLCKNIALANRESNVKIVVSKDELLKGKQEFRDYKETAAKQIVELKLKRKECFEESQKLKQPLYAKVKDVNVKIRNLKTGRMEDVINLLKNKDFNGNKKKRKLDIIGLYAMIMKEFVAEKVSYLHKIKTLSQAHKYYTSLINGIIQDIKNRKESIYYSMRIARGSRKEKIEYLKQYFGEQMQSLRENEKRQISAFVKKMLRTRNDEMVELACKQLTNKNLIKKSLVLPFRFLTAIKELQGVKETGRNAMIGALNEALEISLDNVPHFEGKTLVVLDVSGSMTCSPDNQKLSPAEIGSVFAAMLYKSNNADLMIFDDDARYIPLNRESSIISLINKIDYSGGGTNFHSIFQRAKIKYERIIILSDMQGWIGYDSPKAVFNAYKARTKANPFIYSFDLTGYGSIQFPESQVFCIAGFSEKIFDVMAVLEQDKNALVNKINSIEL